MAETLRHCGIVVSDLKEALPVFEDYLGCGVVTRLDNLKGDYYDELLGIADVELDIVILRTDDDSRIELLQYTSAPVRQKKPVYINNIGVSHVALTVNSLQRLYDRADRFPVRFLSPPTTNPQGSVKVAFAVLMEEALVELVEVLK